MHTKVMIEKKKKKKYNNIPKLFTFFVQGGGYTVSPLEYILNVILLLVCMAQI